MALISTEPAIAPSEMARILLSSPGSRCQASTSAPNTAMPAASAKMKVTSVAKSSLVGTKPQAHIESVPIVPPTSAAASAETSRKITTWRGRSKGYGVPARPLQGSRGEQRFQDAADAGADVGERVHGQRRVGQQQQRKAVEELAGPTATQLSRPAQASYGFPAGGRHDIEIQVAWRPDGPDGAALEATVSDDGVPFDPLAAVPPDLGVPVEHRKVGGLGIHLLRALTEEIDYRRDGGRNVLRFRLRAGGRRGQD